mgnify:CR=1 FL=1
MTSTPRFQASHIRLIPAKDIPGIIQRLRTPHAHALGAQSSGDVLKLTLFGKIIGLKFLTS